jgi:amidohydrolase
MDGQKPGGSDLLSAAVRFPEARVRDKLPGIIQLRRTLHAIPELGLDLPQTAAVVEAELRALGLRPHRVGSGMWVDIGERGPRVAIRADMDALPLQELTGLPHASRFPGRMHACGHDAHTACLLGAAGLLAEEAASLPFRARLIFQAGEEGCFGARPLIEAGVLEGVAAIVGGHVGAVSCELEPGQAGFLHGPMMASSDRFRGVFIGSGGHASEPHRTPDPVTALAEFVLALNGMRARELDQTRPAVVSVCSVRAGEAFNVIPERSEFKGTARCIHRDVRAVLAERIGAIAQGIARMHGLELDYQWIEGYPPVVNDVRASTAAAEAARDALGAGRVTLLDRPSMGGEDFAFYLEKVPGCYWFLNTAAPERGIGQPNHSPRFEVDEQQLWALTAVNLAAAERLAVEFGQED